MASGLRSRLAKAESQLAELRPRGFTFNVEGMAQFLENLPDDWILGREVWLRPSEAGERQPCIPVLSYVVNLHERPGDYLKPFHEIVTPEQRAEIKAKCREVAGLLRQAGTRQEAWNIFKQKVPWEVLVAGMYKPRASEI